MDVNPQSSDISFKFEEHVGNFEACYMRSCHVAFF